MVAELFPVGEFFGRETYSSWLGLHDDYLAW